MNSIRLKYCTVCNESFGCGNESESQKCWCNDLPPIFTLDGISDCLCPSCLKKATISKIEEYVATARKWDGDFQKRIDRHQNERKENWINVEEEKNLSQIDFKGKVAVVDCVTLWLTNFFVDTKNDVELSLDLAKAEIEKLSLIEDSTIIIITNEIGMGVHAETHIGRKFVELQGWVNQFIAKKAEKVTFMVSGLPMQVK